MSRIRYVLVSTAILTMFVHFALGQAAEPKPLPRLRVSDNHRFLVAEDGRPFLYLADTAWELFHQLNREEVEKYLADRATKGFNVIQAVALAELDGLTVPNAYGHLPLVDKTDPTRPAITDGLNNDYWDHVDEVIDLAARKGLYIGLLPTWGRYVTSHWANGIVDGIFHPVNAQQYGEFIGKRYKDRTNIIWIIGGDRAAPTKESQAIWRAMAKGIAIGVSGREDYDAVLMTYHTSGPGHASDFFHEDPWLDFTSIQSSHGDRILNWKMIEKDYARQPVKPVIDLETTYPDALIVQGMKPGNDDHARRSAYWSVFAGACGHTYGHNSIWQMWAPGQKPILNPKSYWYDAIQAPSAAQMGILRKLIESRSVLSRVPDQSLLACDPGEGIDHLRATRGDGYAMIYSPNGRSFKVHLDRLSGKTIRASWFDPRTSSSRLVEEFTKQGDREFDPPGEPDVGNDWVLLLDDADTPPAPGGVSEKRDSTRQSEPGEQPIKSLAVAEPIRCESVYRMHLQGICTDDKSLFWSFTDVLVKTDTSGQILKKVSVANHHGDLCYLDGRIYVAVNLGKFNDPQGNSDSWVYVYHAESLSEVARHRVAEVFYGAGGIGCHAGRFIVVGGLPPGIGENYAYEYDMDFKFVRKHTIQSGYTLMGIQTATYSGGYWWFGCYGKPEILLKTDEAFKLIGKYELNVSLGIVGQADGSFLVARGTSEPGKGHTATIFIADADAKQGLAIRERPLR